MLKAINDYINDYICFNNIYSKRELDELFSDLFISYNPDYNKIEINFDSCFCDIIIDYEDFEDEGFFLKGYSIFDNKKGDYINHNENI